ncbi:myosin-J heavy chain [Exaiptasia diaphana]|uniref:Uncharacterized protein n=1 Tax=Exaiptasia diaphana TaxID=2652724 RepID=A0A913XFK4_EXADI|nr:myosin-J heavy chain [Exaiptasia diaphana]XP_020903983.1 myosin-J heavy chain [Exaiptasia diaphana]KXJ12300.1 hypothetical protein AC249_AIPGENE29155 [Exaiptasia diaphana]
MGASPEFPQKEIERLTSKLREREEEIREKDHEIERLKTKLSKKENKNASERFKKKIIDLEKEILSLKEENQLLREEIDKMNIEKNQMQNEILEMKDNMKNQDQEIKDLRTEQSNQQIATFDKIKSLEKKISNDDLVYIGEIAYKFCKSAYIFVMGISSYKDYHPYNMERMEQYIEKIEDDSQKNQTVRKWDELKRKVGWSWEMGVTLSQLRKDRNDAAHPKNLDKETAKKAIDDLKKKKKLKGETAEPKVHRIVDIWFDMQAEGVFAK